MAQVDDVTIEKPLASGATDFPDAPQSGATAPPPLPAGYQRAGQVATAPPLPTGYQRAGGAPKTATQTPQAVVQPKDTTPPETMVNKGLDAVLPVYNGIKRGVNYAMGDDSSTPTPQKSSLKSTLTVPGAPAPVTFQDKNAQSMQPMSYLDPSGAGQATNAGKLQGLPGVDARTPRFREGLGDVMTAAAPLALPAAIAAPAATAGALVGGGIGAKVGGKVGGTVAEAIHEGAGPTGEDVGSTAGMLLGAHRGGVAGEQVGREATPQNPEPKAPLKDLTDVQRKATNNVESLGKDREAAKKKLDTAQEKYDQHVASHEQGIESPKPVKNALDKAKAEHDEAVAHHDLAKERLANLMAAPTAESAPKANTAPEPEITAKPEEPALSKIGAPKTPPTVSPAHATTTIPQEPTAAPKASYGQLKLPGGEPVGTPKQLTEGTPEGPQVPKGGLPKINLPEEKPAVAPKPERGDVKTLTTDKKGNVIDKEGTVEGRVGKLLQDALKPEAPKAETPAPAEKPAEYKGEERRGNSRPALMSPVEIENAMKNRKPVHTPFDVTEGAMDTINNDPMRPKHPAEENPEPSRAEAKGTPDTEPGLMKTGEEGREPAKSAAEYHPAVQEQVFHLSNSNLDKLATAHGLEPNAPEYSRSKEMRNEGRHQTGRQKLAEDVTAQMGDDEKINIGRNAENLEHNPAMANKPKAERAASLFPRLRGPVDEAGNPKVSGGAPETVTPKEFLKEAENHPDLHFSTEHEGELENAKGTTIRLKNVSNPDRVRISDLSSTTKGRGGATDMLKTVTALADKHGMPLELTASPYGDESTRLNHEQLKTMYEKHGFVSEKGKDEALGYMVREPKAPETVGTQEAADKDNEHFANAKKELGANASISDVAKRAQEIKDTHAQLAEHEKNGGSTFSSKGKDLNGTDKYSVGAYPDRTEQVDKLTPERLDEFKKKNADVLSKEDHAVGTWKDPDTGKAVLDVTKLYDGKDEAIAAGKAANQKAIFHLGGEGEIKTGGTGEVNAKGSPVDEFGNPTVSGGAPEKKLPTGDALIKKYGESSGDPKDTVFILNDGRGVKNTGSIHDEMLGGKATDRNPPRERFVAEGNIRVRPHQGAGGREVSFSIPEKGVNEEQLAAIKKMSPQLRSGGVLIEVGKPGGKYEVIPYGEATDERIEQVLSKLGEKKKPGLKKIQ